MVPVTCDRSAQGMENVLFYFYTQLCQRLLFCLSSRLSKFKVAFHDKSIKAIDQTYSTIMKIIAVMDFVMKFSLHLSCLQWNICDLITLYNI